MSEENLVLKAVLSQLIADRDDYVSQIDRLLNGKFELKFGMNIGGDIVSYTKDRFKDLTTTEQTIITVQKVMEFNAQNKQSDVPDILDALNKIVTQPKTENNNDNGTSS